jgi:hypothetical protein
MHSDEWLAKRWASDPRAPLHDGVDYRLWRNEHGDVVGVGVGVGVGVDFEWAGNVHHELTAAAFRKLLQVLKVGDGQEFEGQLRDVTRHHHDLEKVLPRPR